MSPDLSGCTSRDHDLSHSQKKHLTSVKTSKLSKVDLWTYSTLLAFAGDVDSDIMRPAGHLNRYLSLNLSNVKRPRTTTSAPERSVSGIALPHLEAKLHVGMIWIHFCDPISRPKGNDDSLHQRLANKNTGNPFLGSTLQTEKGLPSPSLRRIDRQMTHWKQHQSQGVQSTKQLRGFCDSATLSTSKICNDSVGPWRNVVARRSSQLVKRLFSLNQMRTRSVFHCGPRNEKQTRTLTDAEDCCEDVCIVLICGWSVDVLCQHPPLPSDSAVWHMSFKRQHSHKNPKLRALHKRIK